MRGWVQNPLKKQFRTEVLLMGDWVGGNTTKVATITRLINLVCGTGTCSPDTVNEVRVWFSSCRPQCCTWRRVH